MEDSILSADNVPPRTVRKTVTEPDSQMLDDLLTETFHYFRKERHAETGLVYDSTAKNSASSIAAVGLGLSCNVVAVEHGLLSRKAGREETLKVLRFLVASPQSDADDASGYKGFFYHFIDAATGKRAGHCELSTIDTALLLAGVLTAAAYFSSPDADESAIRQIARELYERVDWQWALTPSKALSHGWTPESGFLLYSWDKGYSEAMILYILALGASHRPIDGASYKAWADTFEWHTVYGYRYIYAGPLFIHQLPQIWLDLRGIKDDLTRRLGFDYFENSRRATFIQRQYAIENPLGFSHYGEYCWGLTASDGPGPSKQKIDGCEREFFGYRARGVPYGPDDGTVSPWAVASSLPFAPEVVVDTLHHAINRLRLKNPQSDGFDASFNPTFPERGDNENGWISPLRFGLNQGPIILMIANTRNRLIWNLFSRLPEVVTGLRRAGFQGGWLDAEA